MLADGFNSEPVEIDASRVVVLRVAEHRPSRQRPLEEVQETIERSLAVDEARRLADESGRAILDRLQGGEDPAAVASQSDLAWSGESEITRDTRAGDMSVVNAAFRLPRPGAGQIIYGGTGTDDGDYVIIGLRAVTDGVMTADEQEQRDAARRNLEIESGRATYDAMVKVLRDDANVVLFEENL